MKGLTRLIAALSVGMLLLGCDDGRVRPDRTTLTVVNAAPSYPDINFYRGQNQRRAEATLPYLGSARLTYDADLYNYSLRTATPDGLAEEVVQTFSHRVAAGVHYTYVLAEAAGAIVPLIFERPPFATTNSGAEFSIVHAAEAAPSVDIYLEPSGTDLATVSPRATLGFRDRQAPIGAAAGDYVITITAPGDRANVLFTSTTLTLPAGQSVALVIVSGAGSGVSDFFVIAASETASSAVDTNAGSAVRVINGVGDRLARDIYLNGDFTAPAIPAVGFGTGTDFTPFAAGVATFAVTPQGNASVVEREIVQGLADGTIYDFVLAGDASAVTATVLPDNRRTIRNVGRLQIINLLNAYEVVDVFVLPPGNDIGGFLPTFQLGRPGASGRTPFPVGDVEFTVRDTIAGTVLLGPRSLSLPAAGIYTIVLIDGPDGTTPELLLLDDFL